MGSPCPPLFNNAERFELVKELEKVIIALYETKDEAEREKLLKDKDELVTAICE